MKPAPFELHRPRSLEEAFDQLAEFGEDAKVLAGGQSLVPLLNFRLARPEHVIDLGHTGALTGLSWDGTALTVEAMTPQAHLERTGAVADHAPLVAAALPHVAHPPIRIRGTFGGSVAHADPAAELPAVALALDATMVAESRRGQRTIPAREFFQGFLTTALEPDELLVAVRLPAPAARTGAAVAELARRVGDFALAGVVAQVTLDDGDRVGDARVAFVNVADVPYRAAEVESMVRGQRLDGDLASEAAALARTLVDPSGDLHADAAYRRHLAGTLLARALTEAVGAARADARPERVSRSADGVVTTSAATVNNGSNGDRGAF